MKATIDLPDDLYRRVKARSALEGRTIREVVAELLSAYVDGRWSGVTPADSVAEPATPTADLVTPSWVGAGRPHLSRASATSDWSEIQKSIERGWVAETDAVGAPKGKRRG